MRIAIVGGGIGGLTAALALAGPGREITLFERRTGFSEPGAGIQLSPNATGILVRLGLLPSLTRSAVEPDGMAIRALASGREIGRIGFAALAARFGAPYLALARSDLHTALLDAVRGRDAVAIRLGRAPVEITQDDHGATLVLDRSGGGRETASADLVVAADGLWSGLRGATGDPRRPIASGFNAYRTTLPRAAAPPAFAEGGGLWLGSGRHVVHYPVAAGRLINVVVVARGAARREGWSADAPAAEVRAALSGGAAPLVDLARADAAWSAWTLRELPARRMARGRLALLGDAAHPVLPYLAQGGALAIEDAAVLAACLDGAPDIRTALRSYERQRLPRVRRVQQAARRNALAYHAGWPVAAIRDRILNRAGPAGMGERYAWLYGWRPPG